jgi:fructose-specific phosphotransferase system IIA component
MLTSYELLQHPAHLLLKVESETRLSSDTSQCGGTMTRVSKIILLLIFLGVCAFSLFANAEGEPITERMAVLVLQIGLIVFAVRAGGALAKKIHIPTVLGELLSGVIIGPWALGGISLPEFPHGIFPVASATLSVSPELYGFATVASIILLFASGLETDLGLFLRYSVAGGIIGIGGALLSFAAGAGLGVIMLDTSFGDPRCLFLGILSTATSVGITARILSDQKKMDSPEGVTILAAAVFDDVLGIVFLAVVLGIVTIISGSGGGSIDTMAIAGIAIHAIAIWLGFTILGLIFSKRIAKFLKVFKSTHEFSILALGIALLLAGIFEKQGLAMIIGAYVAGLSLSRTDIATVIQERIRGLYEFFVPVFFAVMGMLVNLQELFNPEVLIFGGIYTLIAVISKVAGCGLPAMTLGFNPKGALRIGLGMVPRGEVALIIAGIGLATGVLNEQLFGVTIMMTLLTTLLAPPLLSMSLKLKGAGTRKPVKGGDTETISWEFPSDEIADLVVDTLLKDLRREGFYVQMMNIDEGLSQARKDDISLSITEVEHTVTIETAKEDLALVKTAIYEVIVSMHDSINRLKESSDPAAMRLDISDSDGRTDKDILSLVRENCVSMHLKADTKETIIHELAEVLNTAGYINDVTLLIEDVLHREDTMSTGMQHGIALPHAKSDAVKTMCVAVGIKPEGIPFDSIDGEPSRLFILVVSPKRSSGPHIQFLAAVAALLKNEDTREKVLAAKTPAELVAHFHPVK